MSLLDEIQIVYEDADLLVINKPAGLVVHADGKTQEVTVVDWLLAHYPDMSTVGEPIQLKDGTVIPRPGIVHRIDRDTSGALLIAKTSESFLYLKDLFKQRAVRKVYRAFIVGGMREPRGIISRPINRSKTDFRKWSTVTGRGFWRDAVTHYRTLLSAKGIAYLEIRPQTGRTHQIRVHVSSLGHPIVHDNLYGQPGGEALGFDRLALHAYSLEFTSPSGTEIMVTAPLPADFIKAEEILKDIAK